MLNLRAPTLFDSLVARLLMVTKFNKTAFGSEMMEKITLLGLCIEQLIFVQQL